MCFCARDAVCIKMSETSQRKSDTDDEVVPLHGVYNRPQRKRRPPRHLGREDVRGGDGSSSFGFLMLEGKKRKSVCTPSYRRSQFPDDFVVRQENLYCIYCNHPVDYVHKNSAKEHLKSNKHKISKEKKLKSANKETPPETKDEYVLSDSQSDLVQEETSPKDNSDSTLCYEYPTPASSVAATGTSVGFNMLDVARDCVLSLTYAGITINKLDQLIPFFEKYFAPNVPIPGYETISSYWLPTFFQSYFSSLCKHIANKKIYVIVDAAPNKDSDSIIVNVLVGIADKVFMIDCVPLKAYTASTYSQAVLGAFVKTGISFDDVYAVVTDITITCQKAFNDILVLSFPNAIHVLCLRKVLEQVQQVWIHSEFCCDVNRFLRLLDAIFSIDNLRKHRWLHYLKSKGIHEERFPPKFNSETGADWSQAIEYHGCHIDHYVDFFHNDANELSTAALEELLMTLSDRIKYESLKLKLTVLVEAAKRMSALNRLLLQSGEPLAAMIYCHLDELHNFLKEGISHPSVLDKLSVADNQEAVTLFSSLFDRAFQLYNAYYGGLPAREVYRACRVLDPCQASSLPRDMFEYSILQGFTSENQSLSEEWTCYQNIVHSENVKAPCSLSEYWELLKLRLPNLSQLALLNIWFPVSLVSAERSQSLYNTLLMDDGCPLTPDNVRYLTIINFNGDILQFAEK